ncbi:16S rRNA (guanine(527)-N(7))-methyltransferase RsmG [Paucilactobacillus suebicus]|uniref:Ribosomal RNA small subunit methyltransferase G n=1 Tax=Paucilactobacillus suebicus DSM 5007 = KCTC 3549 TaxID=1423807 RepID=A0A0R1W8X5_9LACO|nr:16S rRNA (guanine(527)-N(7))-methyltransferase RsmG [Paucilactobacillus suebicus]KRM11635.1 16S rRNA methyltransferase GidB [Paucilactobacillus suebicus DSM 5007 = KCTC 3549]
MNPQQFRQALADHGINLTDHQMQQFQTYYEDLVTGNEQVNLTSITERDEVYLKHFYDSITPAIVSPQLQNQSLTLCDVGAGAGFPSLPIKIAFPQLKVTIVDALNKRISFLEKLVDHLGLSDVTLIHDRAETFGAKKSQYREAFDVVTARAVARLSVLSELCIPLVSVSGIFIAMKASQADDEMTAAKHAVEVLGAEVAQTEKLSLPVNNEPRTMIVMNKVTNTPDKYPRRPGVPNKKPIS